MGFFLLGITLNYLGLVLKSIERNIQSTLN